MVISTVSVGVSVSVAMQPHMHPTDIASIHKIAKIRFKLLSPFRLIIFAPKDNITLFQRLKASFQYPVHVRNCHAVVYNRNTTITA